MDEGYVITRVCKDDLRILFKDNAEALKKIEELDDADMSYLAEKLADDYLNQLFWNSLKIIFTEMFMEDSK